MEIEKPLRRAAPNLATEVTGDTRASGLLERDKEIDCLRDLFFACGAGQGGAVSIVGPAGIGKSRLVAAGAQLAADAGLTLLSARGGELERGFPYGVARQLFESVVLRMPPAQRRSVLSGAAAHAAAPLGMGADPDGDASGFRAVHGLYWLCANLGEGGPLAIVVDDLHFCDSASFRFLAYLQARVSELPIVVVTASRPIDDESASGTVGIPEDGAIVPLRPSPLSAEATACLVEAELGTVLDAETAATCHVATGGNPFLCVMVASALNEGHTAERGQEFAHKVAEAMGGVIVRRLGRLTPDAKRLARAVAVLGTNVAVARAAMLAKLPDDRAVAAAGELAGCGVLDAGLPLEFVHPLVREAIGGEIPGAERSMLDSNAARLLIDLGEPAGRVAAHLMLTEPGSRPWVVAALRDAAVRATEVGDPSSAARYLLRASLEPPNASERGVVLHELGTAALNAGDPTGAALHLERAWEFSGSGTARGAVGRDLAAALAAVGRYADAVDVASRAVLESGKTDLACVLEADLYQCAMMDPSLYRSASSRPVLRSGTPETTTPGGRALLTAAATEACLNGTSAAQVRTFATRTFAAGLLDDAPLYCRCGVTPRFRSCSQMVSPRRRSSSRRRCRVRADRGRLSGRSAHTRSEP